MRTHAFLFALLILGGRALAAHEGHATTDTPPPLDSAQVQQHQPTGGGDPSPGFSSPSPSLIASLTEHIHNKLVHFPIALSLVAVLFVWLAVRWPFFETAAEVLVWMAAFSATAAVATGLLQASPFEGTPKAPWVDRHQILGLTTTAALYLWGWMFRFRPARKGIRLWGIVVALLVSLTGSLGGLLSHG